MINWTDLDDFTTAFLECALWATTTTDPEGNSVDNLDDHLGIEDLCDATLKQAVEDCDAFRDRAKGEWAGEYDADKAGHHFFLTREGHGAGFWDGDWSNGDTLTAISKPFGDFDFEEKHAYYGTDGECS